MKAARALTLMMSLVNVLVWGQPARADQIGGDVPNADFFVKSKSCDSIPSNVLSAIGNLTEMNPDLNIDNVVIATFGGMIGNCWTSTEPDPVVEFNIDLHNSRILNLTVEGVETSEPYLCGVSTMQVGDGADPVAIIHLPDTPAGLSQDDCIGVLTKGLSRANSGETGMFGRRYYH